jgi:hypothetical protein
LNSGMGFTAENILLPGDMKEVLPEPSSPIDLMYIAEPVPSYEQLYHRMRARGIRPTGRFLAFLIETSPHFSMTMDLLESAKDDYDGELGRLLDSSLLHESSTRLLPEYVVAAFVRFLCRFGRFSPTSLARPAISSKKEHEHRLKLDQNYLPEYAYALLLQLRPHHRPTWTAYMEKLLFGTWDRAGTRKSAHQYNMICNVIDNMQEAEIDLDEDQFRLFCTAVRYAAQSAYGGSLSMQDAHHVIATAPYRIRMLFHTLVSSHLDSTSHTVTANMEPIPSHIPGPATLHAFVRALGILRDHEGLYSFSTWATNNATKIMARANAQHSGRKALRRALIALRAALDGVLEEGTESAPAEVRELVKNQVEGVDEWGGWPSDTEVDWYTKGKFRVSSP